MTAQAVRVTTRELALRLATSRVFAKPVLAPGTEQKQETVVRSTLVEQFIFSRKLI